MKISNTHVAAYNIPLAEPFSYFTATLTHLPYVLITLETDSGIVGYGEAALAWDVTGETQKGAFGAWSFIQPILAGCSITKISDIAHTMETISQYVAGNTGLKSGIEMALFDALGKSKKQSVHKLLHGTFTPFIIPQKVLSFHEQQSKKIQAIIHNALEGGIKFFKFKGGYKNDVEQIKKILKLFPKINAVIDVNQGWHDARAAITNIRKLERQNILWIEQPVPFQDYAGLAEIKKNVSVPIMADESCHTLLDLENLCERNAIDMINIKLAKCGGMLEAQKMIQFCEQHKIKYTLGDMLHSSLGTAANLHAATLGNFATFDLTMPARIEKDRFKGLLFDNYQARIPTTPGLGVAPIHSS